MANHQGRVAHRDRNHQQQAANGQQHPQPVPKTKHNDHRNQDDRQNRRAAGVALRRRHFVVVQNRFTGQADPRIGKLSPHAVQDAPNFRNGRGVVIGRAHIVNQARVNQDDIHPAGLENVVALPLHLLLRLPQHFLTKKRARPRR